MTKRVVSLFVSLYAAAVVAPAMAAPTGMPVGLDAMWKAGDKAFEEKHFKDAVGWFEKASKYSDLMAQPKDRRAQLYRSYGQALVYAELFDKAIPQLTTSIDLIDQTEFSTQVKEGQKAHAYGLLADAYAGKKKYYEAAEYTLKQLNAQKTRFPDIKSNGLLEAKIGGWYFHANMKDKAKQWLSEAEQLLKDDIASGKSLSADLDERILQGVQKMLPECN